MESNSNSNFLRNLEGRINRFTMESKNAVKNTKIGN